jgi:DNA-binding MarR family transcriptional regulator
MGEKLKNRMKMKKFESDQQEALFNIFLASNYLSSNGNGIFADHNITPSQYNVLRILKGIYPDGFPRCEIISRMIDQSPDVTRLIDRLEKERLVERFNSNEDRRLSIARITQKGLALLEEMHPRIVEYENILTKSLTKNEINELSRICEKIY